MFGKKLSKGFLVDSTGGLVKEFALSDKADVDFSELQQAIRSAGDLRTLTSFQAGKSTATVIRGDRLYFVAVGKGVASEEDVSFLHEILNAVERSFDAALQERARKTAEAEALAGRVKELEERERFMSSENTDLEKRNADIDRTAEMQQRDMAALLAKMERDNEDLKTRAAGLDSRELAAKDMEAKLVESEARLERMSREFDKWRGDIEKREVGLLNSIKAHEMALQAMAEKEGVIAERERAVLSKEGALEEARTRAEAQKEEALSARQELERTRADVAAKESALADQTHSIGEREDKLREETENLRRRQEGLAFADENLDLRVKGLADRERAHEEEMNKARGKIKEEMARLEAERRNVAGRFAELETKERVLDEKEKSIEKARADLDARELSLKDKIAETEHYRQGLESEMDRLAEERHRVEQMHDHLEKRKKVIAEQVDSIAEITRKLEELRSRSRRRAEDAAAQAALTVGGTDPHE